MKATYYQRGETLDYFPTENVESGAVVNLGTRIGVAAAPIRAGEQGAAVYYNATAEAITATADGNTPAGYAAAAVATTDTTVLVKLLG